MNIESQSQLTLELNRDFIKRAKEAGVDISVITEQLLEPIKVQLNKYNTFNDLVYTYEAFFNRVKDIEPFN